MAKIFLKGFDIASRTGEKKMNEDACCKLCRWQRSDKEGVCVPNFLIVNGRTIPEPKACVGNYEDAAKFETLMLPVD